MRAFLSPLLLCLFVGKGAQAQGYTGPITGSPTRGLFISQDPIPKDSLVRIKTLRDIFYYKELGVLVDLPDVITGFVFNVTGRNAADRLVARPELVRVLVLIGEKFEATRRKKLILTSILRPESQQAGLRRDRLRQRKNGRKVTIPATPKASLHPTGTAADISMRNLSGKDRVALRQILKSQTKLGQITFIEEGNPRHFHISAKIRKIEETSYGSYVIGLGEPRQKASPSSNVSSAR
jgi:hypothetical protein